MASYTVFTKTAGKELANKVVLSIERMTPKPVGVGIFKIEDGSGLWEIGIYFSERPNSVELRILEEVYNLIFLVSEVENKNWVEQVRRELTPVNVGRFAIFGAHDRHTIPINSKGLCIEAAMAFGTGHHESTTGCLEALDRLKKRGYRFCNIADIGCGTGVLAMAAASVYTGAVLASDIDKIATETASTNFLENGFMTRIRLFRARGFENSAILRRAPFDLIFANILAKPLCRMAKEMYRCCKTKGVIVLAGILNKQAKKVENYYALNGFSRLSIIKKGEWTTIIMMK